MKTVVTISRYWHNPQIMTVIWKDGISLTMNMPDFVEALKKEIGSVTWTLRDKTFEQKIDLAISNILSKIKEESAKTLS
jgi:hypothetical protein